MATIEPLIAGAHPLSNRVSKRLFDLVFASLALLSTSWLIAILVLIATIDTGRSGLFIQMRVGKGGKPFRLAKIRTMKGVPGLSSTVTTSTDPRVTFLGRWLRATKLDELPQLLNVLAGSMSIVGPRPTVEEDVARMTSRQQMRFQVKPGLTGLAQIHGNTSLPWPERIEYDLDYVRRQSLILDLEIIWRTIKGLFLGRLATHPPSSSEWEP